MTKKDLNVKIGNKKEVLWTAVHKNALEVVRQAEEQVEIQNAIAILALKKINVEKEKFK